MSRVYYEVGTKFLTKRREELCGDSIVYSRLPNAITLIHSDGLGSGVKASIIATLTTSIASRLLNDGLPIDTVVETIVETLPVCQVRKIAYSTFTIAKLMSTGEAHVFNFDNPPVMVFRNGAPRTLHLDTVDVGSRKIKEARFDLRDGDWIVSVSDGVINAGIGGAYALGWGLSNVAEYLATRVRRKRSAQSVADELARTALDLYEGSPGDDVSIVVLKVRVKHIATVLTGPPMNREDDGAVVEKLLGTRGKRIVCGGTTATIIARSLNRPLEVDMTTARPDVPPSGRIEGIDLVTEGILTLTEALTLLRQNATEEDVQYRVDGAANLLRNLLRVDAVTFIVGRAINPSHQNPNMPSTLGLKINVVNEIAELLRKRDKEVEILLF